MVDKIGRPATSAQTGIPESTLRGWINNPPVSSPIDQVLADIESDDQHIPAQFLDNKTGSVDIWEYLRVAREVQAVADKASVGQHEARVKIETDRPVVIVPTGDWHFASYSTDHQELEDQLRYVLDTPHLYLIDLGDNIENFTAFKSVGAVINQVLPPALQKEWYKAVLTKMVSEGKILARTWSNHVEEFDERIWGGQVQEFNRLVPYLKDDGRLFLTVGDTEYKIWAKHVAPGRSIYNVNHGNKRAARFEWTEADIYVSAHTHDGPEHDVFIQDGRPKLAMKVPTTKVWSTWSRRYFGRCLPGMQGIVLHPDQHKIVPFYNVEDAVGYRDYLVSK